MPLLCLLLTNKEGLVRDGKVRAVLGAATTRRWSLVNQENGRRKIVGSQRGISGEEDFSLFRDLLVRVPWDTGLERKGIEERSWIFKDYFLQAQELSILFCWKSSKADRRPAWISKELLTKIKHKTEVYQVLK